MFSLLVEGGVCHVCSTRKDLLLAVKSKAAFRLNLVCDRCLILDLEDKASVRDFFSKAFHNLDSRFITVAQAVEKYHISKTKIYKNINKKNSDFPAIKIPGKSYRIDEMKLKAWLEEA